MLHKLVQHIETKQFVLMLEVISSCFSHNICPAKLFDILNMSVSTIAKSKKEFVIGSQYESTDTIEIRKSLDELTMLRISAFQLQLLIECHFLFVKPRFT